MAKTKFICSYCGSDDILFDAWAAWNKETQEMELQQHFPKPVFCNVYGGETNFKQIDIVDFEIYDLE